MSEIEKYYNGEIHVDFEEKTKENNFGKAVEFIVESDFNKDLNKCLDIVKELDKKDKVITELLRRIANLEYEVERQDNILEQVEGYVDKLSYQDIVDNPKKDLQKILEKKK